MCTDDSFGHSFGRIPFHEWKQNFDVRKWILSNSLIGKVNIPCNHHKSKRRNVFLLLDHHRWHIFDWQLKVETFAPERPLGHTFRCFPHRDLLSSLNSVTVILMCNLANLRHWCWVPCLTQLHWNQQLLLMLVPYVTACWHWMADIDCYLRCWMTWRGTSKSLFQQQMGLAWGLRTVREMSVLDSWLATSNLSLEWCKTFTSKRDDQMIKVRTFLKMEMM